MGIREVASVNSDTSDGASVILFPQYEELKNEVQKLRTELSMLVLERDELKLIECRNIEMAYLLSLGGLEYKAYEIDCSIHRLKRKIELIQAKKNRQEKVVLADIEKVLDDEFADYKEKLNEQIDKMNAALERSKGTMLTDDETAELKKLYRSIVKALHPDLNPDLSDAQISLFHNAVYAYEHGDLNGIRVIAAMVSDPEPPKDDADSMKLLMKDKERLSTLMQNVKDDIAKIKASYPYTLKPYVQDEKKAAARKAELEGIIDQLNDALASYTAKLAEMMR